MINTIRRKGRKLIDMIRNMINIVNMKSMIDSMIDMKKRIDKGKEVEYPQGVILKAQFQARNKVSAK